MDHREAARYWDGNAEVWTQLARQGYDVYRDYLNAPAFVEMLPEVKGLVGLDIGCGEGYNTRKVAERGVHMVAFDVSSVFVLHAKQEEDKEPQNIRYCVASGVEMPFLDAAFDFAMATMSMMDIPEWDVALAEAFRVLKPGAFLQFSICHPCFDTLHRRNLRDEEGKTYAIEVGNYFDPPEEKVGEWLFSAAPEEVKEGLPKFRMPIFHRTLSEWINQLVKVGFVLERLEEPRPSDDTVRTCPAIQDAQVVSYFLHIRARKPSVGPL